MSTLIDSVLKNKTAKEAFLVETAISRMTNHIAELLEEHNMTQRQLASKANVSEGRIAQIMDGKNLTLSTIAKVFGAFDQVLCVDSQSLDSLRSRSISNSDTYDSDWMESDSSVCGRIGFNNSPSTPSKLKKAHG